MAAQPRTIKAKRAKAVPCAPAAASPLPRRGPARPGLPRSAGRPQLPRTAQIPGINPRINHCLGK